MTEAEWLAAIEPKPLLRFLREQGSDRKMRLFAVACCRKLWRFLIAEVSRQGVETAERYADGKATREELQTICTLAQQTLVQAPDGLDPLLNDCRADWATAAASATAVVEVVYQSTRHRTFGPFIVDKFDSISGHLWEPAVRVAEGRTQTVLLQDIFGNPFRPIEFDPAWRTASATRLAAAVYEERQLPSGVFENQRLGVVADALEDAACENADILAHLRNGGEHVRGCWVIDLILGKS